MQNSRSQIKQDLSAALAVEVAQWQKAGGIIEVLPSCSYAQQLYCVNEGQTQEGVRVSMKVGTFVPLIAVAKPKLRKAWVMDDCQRDAVNALQRAVYREWIDKGLTQAEAEKIANKEKMRLFYALRRTRETE
tara:strand:+ start:119 stop:514 length:396 start_codon:yes stop_codon:yes gene_type:complete